MNIVPAFRDMQEADLDEVMSLETSGHAYPWTLGIFRDCLRVGYSCQVLEIESRIEAFAVMSVAAGEAHVFNICVRPESRCRGYGRKFIEKMVEQARDRAATTLFLEVRPSNLAALTLYDKMGFNEVGVRKNYYPAKEGREDALILALTL